MAILFGCLMAAVLGTVFVAGVSWFGMLAWNAVVPLRFGGPTLQFTDSFALFVLIWITGTVLRFGASLTLPKDNE